MDCPGLRGFYKSADAPDLGATSMSPLAAYEDTTSTQASEIISVSGLSRWQIEAVRDLIRIASLPHNWDSYGSPPPSKVATKVALNLLIHIRIEYLPCARVTPVSGGGVQIEWDTGRRTLEMEILADGSIEFLKKSS